MKSHLPTSLKTKLSVNTKKNKNFKIIKKFIENAKHQLISKYQNDSDTYNKKIITDITYNEKSHLVAIFKDYLIFDDMSEFLKRYYRLDEAYNRLPKIFEYYESCSKVFPNYVNLEEAKYFYKNIQRKQKVIDEQHKKMEQKEESIKLKRRPSEKDDNKIFVTNVYESIMNQTTLSNRDESFKNLLTIAYNQDINEDVHVFKLENSITSLEKLIETIGQVEKFKFEDKKKKLHEIVMKCNRKFISGVSPSPPTSNREGKNFIWPLSTVKSPAEIIKENKMNNATEFKTNKKTMLNIQKNPLNKILMKDNEDKNNFDKTNFLHKKYKEIKKSRNISSSITNITALKDRIKVERLGSTISTLNNGLSASLSKQKSLTKINQNNEESPIENVTMNQKTQDYPKTTKHKNTSSMPTLTNSMIAMLNKKMKAKKITIYDNIEENIKNEDKNIESKLNTAREKVPKIMPSPISKLNAKNKLTERNNFKKLQQLKPEILNSFNKNKNSEKATNIRSVASTIQHSPLLSQRIKENNYVSIVSNRPSNLHLNSHRDPHQGKMSISPMSRATPLHSSIHVENGSSNNRYSHQRSISKQNFDVKSTLFSFKHPNTGKLKGIPKEDNKNTNKKTIEPNLNKNSKNTKGIITNGIHIKGFSDIIKHGSIQANSHSDRITVKNTLNKMK